MPYIENLELLRLENHFWITFLGHGPTYVNTAYFYSYNLTRVAMSVAVC